MMDLNNIKKWFPESLHERGEDMLREYLQYQILQALFDSKYGHQYTFLGGSCLRIAYGTNRFSEDLDFDNVGLDQAAFEESAAIIQRFLALRGFEVSLRFAYKGAYHCSIRFPGILYNYQLSGHKEAKVLIKLDTEKQAYEYKRDLITLNKFGVDTDILITPMPLLASQKIAAVLGRKRPKGRDFYDLRFLLMRTTPDMRYIQEKIGVSQPEDLRKKVIDHLAPYDFKQLAADVAPFLYHQRDIDEVLQFPDFWATVPLIR